jgi:hypothetical protein
VNNKGKKTLWKKLLVVFGALVVVCCVWLVMLVKSIPTYERHRPLLDIQDSHLLTPTGPIPFEFSNRSAHYPADEDSAGKTIFVKNPASEKTPGFRVSLSIFNASGKGSSPRVFLSDFTSAYDPAKLAVQPGAYYQLNQETKNSRTVTKDIRKDGRTGVSKEPTHLNFNWPKPLSDYDISMSGGSMWPPRVPIIKAGENDSHFLYIPFALGTEEFAIHLRFKVSVHSFQSMSSWGP